MPRRSTTVIPVLVMLVVVAATAAVPLLAAATPTTGGAGTDTTADGVAPGQRLSAAVGAQAAEVRSDLDLRALTARFARADSNASRAALVATTVGDLEERLAELERRQTGLDRRYDAGELSFGTYAALSAQLVARERAVRDLLGATEDRAAELPAQALEAAGVGMERLQTLRQRAMEGDGRAVAEIARDLAGPPDRDDDDGGDRGDRGDRLEAIREAAAAVRQAERQVVTVRRLVDDGSAADRLAEARTALEAAREALAEARAAAANGDGDRAEELADVAADRASDAVDLAEAAREAATGGGEDDRREAGNGSGNGNGDRSGERGAPGDRDDEDGESDG